MKKKFKLISNSITSMLTVLTIFNTSVVPCQLISYADTNTPIISDNPITSDNNIYEDVTINGIIYSYCEECTYDTGVTIPEHYSVSGVIDNANIKDVVLEDNVNNIPVLEISRHAFAFTDIESVTLSSNIKYINESAFANCINLKSVNFGDGSLEIIDRYAFYNCRELKSIDIPEGLKIINSNAFRHCTQLKIVNLPPTLYHLEVAFTDCNINTFNWQPTSVYYKTHDNFISYNGKGYINMLHSIYGTENIVDEVFNLPSYVNGLNVDCIDNTYVNTIGVSSNVSTFYLTYGSYDICIDKSIRLTQPNLYDASIRLVINNPDCVIDCNKDSNNIQNYNSSIIIVGYKDSPAETFAINNGFKFEILDTLEPTILGDANNNGIVDISDAVLIMQSLSNPSEYSLSAQGIANSDVVGFDGVTAMDALAIQCQGIYLVDSKDFPMTAEDLLKILN